MKFVEYEFVSIDEVSSEPCEWKFEDSDELDERLEEHEAIIAVAELLEFLSLN